MFVASLVAMSMAFLCLLYAGFAAGAAEDHQKLGFGPLVACLGLMLAQAGLWVLWGLQLGRVVA